MCRLPMTRQLDERLARKHAAVNHGAPRGRLGILLLPLLALISPLSGCGSRESYPDSHPEARKSFDPPERSTRFSTLDTVKSFSADSAESGNYRPADGDDIFVQVAGRTELSGPHRIGPDGWITNSFHVPGAIKKPGVYRPTLQMSYLDVLAQAGGPIEEGDILFVPRSSAAKSGVPHQDHESVQHAVNLQAVCHAVA